MTNYIYTATGCARCKITKRFMQENDIDYEEYDIKANGREVFSEFYRSNRNMIYRGKDGVEFPVFTDGEVIRQGVNAVIGHLVAGEDLSGFIDRSTLHGDWIDGFTISGGKSEFSEGLLRVLTFLKQNNLKIEVSTDGHNIALLQSVFNKKLVDRVIVDIKGPAGLYEPLGAESIDETELKQTIALAAQFPEYQYYSTVAPLDRKDGTVSYLKPEEIGETARLLEDATGNKKHAYKLRVFDPQQAVDGRFKSIEPLPASAMFKYRGAARRYMVMTEIER